MNKDEMLESILHKLDSMEIKRREWVGLTDEEIDSARDAADRSFFRHMTSIRGQMVTSSDLPEFHLASCIEAALKEKNA